MHDAGEVDVERGEKEKDCDVFVVHAVDLSHCWLPNCGC